jgi:glycosyltransferase involved in cell wall biosynthesis
MKLLIYARDWAPSVGGVQTIVKTLADGLADWSSKHSEEAIEVTLLTQTPAGSMNDSQLPYRVVRKPGFVDFIREIRRADVVHLAGPTLVPLAIGYLLRKPTVVEHHVYQSICPNGLLLFEPDHSVCPGHFMAGRYGKCVECNAQNLGKLGSLRSLLLTFPRRWLCQHVARNIAVTNHVAMRIALPRTLTIYHGTPDSGVRPANVLADHGNGLQIGYVGRLVQEKGLPVLLKAAKLLDEGGVAFHLTFVGDGPERAKLRSLSTELGLDGRVTFTGDLRGVELGEALRAIQVVVMPSEWEETAGLAAMEQMMSGGAVIAANIGGLAEVVGEAGLRFAPGSVDALYASLKAAAESPETTDKISSMARARALKEFSVQPFLKQHASVYRNFSKDANAPELSSEGDRYASS